MIIRTAIATLPIWNAVRRLYLNPLLLRPMVFCSLTSLMIAEPEGGPVCLHTVHSMMSGEEPVNKLLTLEAS